MEEDGHIYPSNETDHILNDLFCWCKPERINKEGQDYVLHKNKQRKTIVEDPMLLN